MSFIENNNVFVGGHIGFSKNLLPTLNEAVNNRMNTVQFFLGNPKSYTRQRLTETDISDCNKCSRKNSLNVFSHYPYTSSLLGTVAQLAWDGNEDQDRKTKLILSELEHELNTLAKISDVNGVVIHPGSYKNRIQGLETIAKSINMINFDENATLLLENSAGEGSKLPRDFVEMSKIFENIDSIKKPNVKCCVDTAHIWGSGIYNLKEKDEVDKLFHDFDKYIGLDRFGLLHLNDSAVPFKSKKDRHECLCNGYIWKENDESLKYLIAKCGENNIPVILETPDVVNDMITIDNL